MQTPDEINALDLQVKHSFKSEPLQVSQEG